MCLEDTVRIPLYARRHIVRAYTLIDDADAAFVTQWRWSLDKNGYAIRYSEGSGKQVRFLLHRELLGLVRGDPREGDHINRDKLDNRRQNLRAIPRQGNRQNMSSRPGSSSSFRGVSWDKSRGNWRATVRVNDKHIAVGSFQSEHEAADAARMVRLKLMPYAVD